MLMGVCNDWETSMVWPIFKECMARRSVLGPYMVKFGAGGYDYNVAFGREWTWPFSSSEKLSGITKHFGFSCSPTLWEQFSDGPFLFKHYRSPAHKASITMPNSNS